MREQGDVREDRPWRGEGSWQWSMHMGGGWTRRNRNLEIFKGCLSGLGGEDKRFPFKSWNGHKTGVAFLGIMIHGSRSNFSAEICLTYDEKHELYIIKKELVQFFFTSVERMHNFCDSLSSNDGVCSTPASKELLLFLFSSKTSHRE